MAQKGNITKKHKGHLQYLFSSDYGTGSSKNTELYLILFCHMLFWQKKSAAKDADFVFTK